MGEINTAMSYCRFSLASMVLDTVDNIYFSLKNNVLIVLANSL